MVGFLGSQPLPLLPDALGPSRVFSSRSPTALSCSSNLSVTAPFLLYRIKLCLSLRTFQVPLSLSFALNNCRPSNFLPCLGLNKSTLVDNAGENTYLNSFVSIVTPTDSLTSRIQGIASLRILTRWRILAATASQLLSRGGLGTFVLTGCGCDHCRPQSLITTPTSDLGNYDLQRPPPWTICTPRILPDHPAHSLDQTWLTPCIHILWTKAGKKFFGTPTPIAASSPPPTFKLRAHVCLPPPASPRPQ